MEADDLADITLAGQSICKEVGKRTKYEDTTPARLLGNLKRMYEWKASGKNIKKV